MGARVEPPAAQLPHAFLFFRHEKMYSFAFIGELLKKGKRFAVSYIVADYLENRENPESSQLLHHVAEYLLNPTEKINKTDVIEWIRWLLGAGKNPEEFVKEGVLMVALYLPV